MPRISRFGGASTNNGEKSSIDADNNASHEVEIQHHHRKSSKYWTVNVKDDAGVTKTAHLRLRDLWVLPNGTRVVLPLDQYNQPIDEAAGLLGQALGELGFDFAAFPIGYDSWSAIPKNYKEQVYNDILKEKFILDDDLAKKTILKRLGERWKDNRSNIFHRYYNKKLTKEDNLVNPPLDISQDEWTRFVEYRLHPKTVKICKQNSKNREKQVVVHTGGSKTLARKRNEMELEIGKHVSRGMVYVATHNKVDGSYQNEAAKTICEKILRIESQGSCSHVIAQDDSLGQVLGKEHSGWVRGMGLGPCPSQVFGVKRQNHNGEGPFFLSSNNKMQQEISELRGSLERETLKRHELENAITLVLPELASILNQMNIKEREQHSSSKAACPLPNSPPSAHTLSMEEIRGLASISNLLPPKEKPKQVTLDFRKALIELQKKIRDVRNLANETGLDFNNQIALLEMKHQQLKQASVVDLTNESSIPLANSTNITKVDNGFKRPRLSRTSRHASTHDNEMFPVKKSNLRIVFGKENAKEASGNAGIGLSKAIL